MVKASLRLLSLFQSLVGFKINWNYVIAEKIEQIQGFNP
ncbi:hypothetical protein BFG60_3052 [Microcystis aeruginosa NIES-98]|nr:hypothetical protein BFG60_3052 [Microcystis aeruginosa NIES-98]